jgi:hypothetical protein
MRSITLIDLIIMKIGESAPTKTKAPALARIKMDRRRGRACLPQLYLMNLFIVTDLLLHFSRGKLGYRLKRVTLK